MEEAVSGVHDELVMEFTNSGTPDLAAILKTLSSFNTPQTGQSQTPNTSLPPNDSRHDNHSRILASNQPTRNPGHRAPQELAAASSRQASGFGPQSKSSVDPYTITTWPAAIKCVMKTVAQNETVQYRIRRLIATQHEHEKNWWQGRQRLLAKQKARVGNQKKLDEVLRAVGGKVTNQPHEAAPQEDELEIKHYDDKVYKASTEMSKALDSELKALGIPFFAIKQDLIRPSPSDGSSKPEDVNSSTDNCITPEEATVLRQRMLELLQDLCKE
ncbi:uncharacterized protein GIQ15_00637 [Arthroderma uncinatum]|uniref:uncharacterized protein n=1 Tax=Arthroderma uncinatum TaxID=74035 RepID=UPI00144A6CD5|nr:uncharacterized protein GIQ15_00637 [Arthroderma uncinatum]KAF3491120.1 hypothetical protein GIQ15_00637 [Arthroderma uncinatum]